ncbi:hypothetical protein FA95DRAFT_1572817 [Auriscalpium vulgare]|uniref:Uncharacterized protein n=1 Tax=Auriscalpium vulgare TaxID=40419 RepID=A0ACB8RSD8_9AGAM|nr:hypothetical protein FA95DRAFT_1572817 [Auriscalpium vulgare]
MSESVSWCEEKGESYLDAPSSPGETGRDRHVAPASRPAAGHEAVIKDTWMRSRCRWMRSSVDSSAVPPRSMCFASGAARSTCSGCGGERLCGPGRGGKEHARDDAPVIKRVPLGPFWIPNRATAANDEGAPWKPCQLPRTGPWRGIVLDGSCPELPTLVGRSPEIPKNRLPHYPLELEGRLCGHGQGTVYGD